MTDRQSAASEGSTEHLPATDDWPRGFGEASVWPVVTALGAGAVYLGVGLFVLARGADPLVPAVVGAVTLLGGLGGLFAGLLGWVTPAFVGRPAASGGSRDLWWGTLLFLGTEIATFGAGFFYYFTIRAGPWPPGELPHLLTSLVLVNTAVLVASSATLHAAHRALRRNARRRFVGLLLATLGLGTAFLAGQAWEYYQLLVGEGYTIASGSYASAFFGLTGLHGLHVTFGLFGLGALSVRALLGEYTAERHTSVTTVSLYWHFVDAVWLFLVVALYVGAAVTI